jgi:hypothetical protein
MADSAETNTPQDRDEEIRKVFETMHIGTQEERTRIVQQGSRLKPMKPAVKYSIRLSNGSGPGVTPE